MAKAQRAKASYADPKEVAAKAAEMPDEFLDCYGLRSHGWGRKKITPNEGGGFYWTQTCGLCGRVRYRWISRRGVWDGGWRYVRLEGYGVQGLGIVDTEARTGLMRLIIERANSGN